MHVDVLVAEIGSTTTVINAFSFDQSAQEPRLLGQGSHPTTVEEGDVRVGLKGALKSLEGELGVQTLSWNEMLACSSAAGGLRMSVHGLVYDMTVKAANEAALGAGAVVKMVTAGELSDTDLRKLVDLRPNIVLLAGGVDYGEKRTVLANARRLGELDLEVPVIYAGNVACRDEIAEILGPETLMVENVYPGIDRLNVEPARRAIQEVFEKHIVTAPGMGGVRDMVSGEIMPTPGAVMEAACLLEQELEDLMVLDVGGATTDVHSVTAGSEEIARLLTAPEPRAKRTVEGDLGVYVNASNLADQVGHDRLESDLGFDPAPALESLPAVPTTEQERALILRLAREAAETAVSRHAGRLRHLYGPTGRITVAEGKDLTGIKWIVGTGGVFTRLPGSREILESLAQLQDPYLLLPREPRILVDSHYIMAAAGVLSRRWPQQALQLLVTSLNLQKESGKSGR